MDNRVIEEVLADSTIKLREDVARRFKWSSNVYNMQTGGSSSSGSVKASRPLQTVVGGIVRGYKFPYNNRMKISQGSMFIQFDQDRSYECEATMVILEDDEACNGVTGERIVNCTRKLCDLDDSIVEAYFSTYCKKIKRWVVVYEKFESLDKDKLPSFFEDGDRLNLSEYWREKIRSFIECLSVSRNKGAVHGGVSLESSYVNCAETVKLINVARFNQHKTGLDDLKDMARFIDTFLQASQCADWEGFDYLVNSRKMQDSDWYKVVLDHPFLLDYSAKLDVYERVEMYMWGVTWYQKTKFANVLYVKRPQYRYLNVEDLLDRNNHISQAVEKECGQTIPCTYLMIIQYVRNMIQHANDYTDTNQKWDDKTMCTNIHTLFPGYMSLAYSISNITPDDWNASLANLPVDFPHNPPDWYR